MFPSPSKKSDCALVMGRWGGIVSVGLGRRGGDLIPKTWSNGANIDVAKPDDEGSLNPRSWRGNVGLSTCSAVSA